MSRKYLVSFNNEQHKIHNALPRTKLLQIQLKLTPKFNKNQTNTNFDKNHKCSIVGVLFLWLQKASINSHCPRREAWTEQEIKSFKFHKWNKNVQKCCSKKHQLPSTCHVLNFLEALNQLNEIKIFSVLKDFHFL